MALQVLLLITLSRLYLWELSQVGVAGQSLRYCPPVVPPFLIRGHQTQAFTDELLDTLDFKTLWDEYGIDGDISVCKSSLYFVCFFLSS